MSRIKALVLTAIFFSVAYFGNKDLFNFDEYTLDWDSQYYSKPFEVGALTAPLYHYFVRIVGGKAAPIAKSDLGSYSLRDQEFGAKIANPYFRITVLQRILYLGSCFFLFVIAALKYGSLCGLCFAVPFFCLGASTAYAGFLLGDVLAQSFLILLLGVFLSSTASRFINIAIAISLSCLASFTRPAFSFALLFPLFQVLQNISQTKRVLSRLLVLLLTLIPVAFENLRTVFHPTDATNLNVGYNYQWINFLYALNLAELRDVDLIESERNKKMVLKAIELKKQAHLDLVGPEFFRNVHIPLMTHFSLARYAKSNTTVYRSISVPILRQHMFEHWRQRLSAYWRAIIGMPSLSKHCGVFASVVLWIFFLIEGLVFLRWGEQRDCTPFKVLAVYLLAAMVLVIFMFPNPRYVNSLEPMLYVAFALLIANRFQNFNVTRSISPSDKARVKNAQLNIHLSH